MNLLKKTLQYFRREAVLTVALIAALASFLLAPPGAHTLAGIDTTTLLMLFSLMAIVAGFRHMGAFDKLAASLTARIRTLRGLAFALVSACFVLAMAATNDVALITLVPFTLLLLAPNGIKGRYLALTVVLETIAANLGSMVTPIGNPQNLYLYSSGRLTALEFPLYTAFYAVAAYALLALLCLLIPKTRVQPAPNAAGKLPARKLWLYVGLAAIALLALMEIIPAWALAMTVAAALFAADRPVLRQVDYTLLATFVCFFVFISSVKACGSIFRWLEELMAASPLLTSLLASQVISNVPACLLLAPFTGDTPALLLGVNIGGLGTIVASLASLISFRLYGAAREAKKGLFMGLFTALNGLFLAVMLLLAWLLGAL